MPAVPEQLRAAVAEVDLSDLATATRVRDIGMATVPDEIITKDGPLDDEEWQLITPLWWAQLIEGACYDLRRGVRDDGWTIRKLLQRSPLMGPDAAEFR